MPKLPSSPDDFKIELAALRYKFNAMSPELEVTVRDPELGVEGYVVVWNTAISRGGPLNNVGKGGTRVTKDLSLDQVKRLARAMAEKNAAAGLPLGGAKSGLRLDPADPDYERKYRRFVELCSPFLHENGGVFGGFGYDVGGIPPLNAIWACDQLNSTRSFTGKPIEMGGTNYDVEGIAGLGVAVAARTVIEESGLNPVGLTFSVQGAGAMGSAVIRYFSAFGGVLKCVSDPKFGGTWTIAERPTANLISALSHRRADEVHDLLKQEATNVSADPAEALYEGVDVLFPCAMEDALRSDNVAAVRARFISEGANNAITDEAYRTLSDGKVRVVPDIIANAGGIIAAFVELSAGGNDDSSGNVAKAKEITESRIAANVRTLISLTDSFGVEADQAADYMAYKNIFEGLGSTT